MSNLSALRLFVWEGMPYGEQGIWFAFAENADEALLLVAAKGGFDPKKKPREVTTAEGFTCWGESWAI